MPANHEVKVNSFVNEPIPSSEADQKQINLMLRQKMGIMDWKDVEIDT